MPQSKSILQQYASGKIVILLFILTNAIYAYMLCYSIPQTVAFAQGLPLLDMQPMGYSNSYISQLFDALGTKGVTIIYLGKYPGICFIPDYLESATAY